MGNCFRVSDRTTGKEFDLFSESPDAGSVEKRLFDLGFLIGTVRPWEGFRVDPDLRESKLATIARYHALRKAGNTEARLLQSLDYWIPSDERERLLAWSASDGKPTPNPDSIRALGLRVEMILRCRVVDPTTGLERWTTPEEEAEATHRQSLADFRFLQPTGQVRHVVAGYRPRVWEKSPTIADLQSLAETECYPNQRFWLLAELVARLARRRKRDPRCGIDAERFAWQLVFEFSQWPSDVLAHPVKWDRFNPTAPLTTLETLLREGGWQIRAAEIRALKKHFRTAHLPR